MSRPVPRVKVAWALALARAVASRRDRDALVGATGAFCHGSKPKRTLPSAETRHSERVLSPSDLSEGSQ